MRAEHVVRLTRFLRGAAVGCALVLTVPGALAQIAYRASSASVTSGSTLTLNVAAVTTFNDVMIASITTLRPPSPDCGGGDKERVQ